MLPAVNIYLSVETQRKYSLLIQLLNCIIYLIYIYRTLYPKTTEYRLFSNALVIFIKLVHTLDRKARLINFRGFKLFRT